MNETHTGGGDPPASDPPEGRLDSWKKIAAYLKRDVSTVQRWERREAMPVHRHLHDKQGSVYAFRSELDAWWRSRGTQVAWEAEGESEPPEESTPGGRIAAPAAAHRAPPLRRWWAAGLGLLLAAAGAAVWFTAERGYFWRNPLANARFTRLTDLSGTEQAAAISRDGKLAAFLSDHEGQNDVWVTEIGSGRYRNLTQGAVGGLINPLIRTLGFSADGALITIWARKSDGSRPGDIGILAAPPSGGPLQPYLPEAAEVSWSSDGSRIVYHTTAPGDPLFVRPARSGDARRIYVAPAGVHCHFPVWSPDDAFIYFSRGAPPDVWDVWRIRPNGDGLERLTFHDALVTHPVFLDRRTLAYLATDAHGAGQWLYVMDVERRVPHRISVGLERYTSLAASADGARLVATLANPRFSLWSVAGAGEGAGPTASAQASPLQAAGFSPRLGANYLLYVSWQGGGAGIWKVADGTSRELWSGAHSTVVGAPAIAPGGRRIAFTALDGDRTLLYVMDSDGSHVRVVTGSLALRGDPAWAPDGRSVVSGVLRDGEPRLASISVDDGTPLPLVSEYSVDPVWSPDGTFLIYSGADVGTTFPLRAAAADGRPYPLPTLMLTRGARRVVFSHDPHSIVILRGEIGHKNFWFVDLKSGAERQLSGLTADFVIRDFDISPDGSRIVFDRVEENSNIALIERAR